jgi:hypothetical protein
VAGAAFLARRRSRRCGLEALALLVHTAAYVRCARMHAPSTTSRRAAAPRTPVDSPVGCGSTACSRCGPRAGRRASYWIDATGRSAAVAPAQGAGSCRCRTDPIRGCRAHGAADAGALPRDHRHGRQRTTEEEALTLTQAPPRGRISCAPCRLRYVHEQEEGEEQECLAARDHALRPSAGEGPLLRARSQPGPGPAPTRAGRRQHRQAGSQPASCASFAAIERT